MKGNVAMKSKWFVLMAFVGLLAVGASVTGPANASSSPPGPPDRVSDFVKSSKGHIYLSPIGGQRVTIVEQSLPAGTWILSATATLVSFGPSDYARCELTKGNDHLAQASTMIGNPDLRGSMGPGSSVASVGVIGKVSSSTGFTAKLRCFHDTTAPQGPRQLAPPYVEADAALWARLSS